VLGKLDFHAHQSTALSSEVDTGSREENASKQEPGASVQIQSEPKCQAAVGAMLVSRRG